jgi:hypothetical protein
VIIPSRPRAFALALALAAACGGALVAIHYHRLGLTLSHYDARGHLVVARRIADSLTPGWQQIGAVWLPLPHVLNAVPVQIDAFYRTGASAVAMSIAAFAIATFALAWLILLITASRWAAAAGVATFALNPNVLYLQSTPMTEPLLIGLMTLAVAMLARWCRGDSGKDARGAGLGTGHGAVGVMFALACLTRYEAWPVTFSALGLALLALHHMGVPWRDAIRRVGAIAVYPALSILAFGVFSRVVIGEWLVAGGFFVPENTALGHPLEALSQIGWGVRALSGDALLTVAAIGLAGLVGIAFREPSRAWVLVSLSLVATAALPWVAFLRGHPYRIRYMVPLIAAEALGVGVAAGLVKRARPAATIALLLAAAFELRLLDAGAPMVVEAQWDRPNVAVRQQVTDCLRGRAPGDAVMASMGSLGHYVQELAGAGYRIDDFLHEGNGDIWLAAIEHPRPYAAWILIEEKAEGGDMLATIAREHPYFLDGYSRVCEGAGLALYRRE